MAKLARLPLPLCHDATVVDGTQVNMSVNMCMLTDELDLGSCSQPRKLRIGVAGAMRNQVQASTGRFVKTLYLKKRPGIDHGGNDQGQRRRNLGQRAEFVNTYWTLRDLPARTRDGIQDTPEAAKAVGEQLAKQDKGWMDESLVQDWIKSVRCRRPGALLGFPSMLVLDVFRCHLADSVRRLLRGSRIELVVIPGGMTSQLQPLDVCINKPFKDHIRRLYMEWMRSGEPEVTPAGRLKRASPALLSVWIAEAWACIPEALVCRAFKKCSISNALDGTEDEVLWEDISNKGTSEENASDEDDE
ncbi:POGO family transposase, putative [Ixodes scapularis]|uniref:POGO family transposase, putative n=1 Tax=Ixodes scapularis TaxID=6945 RepID=B7QDM8_IXOSC|nr:POGO family transposase, putative [Ixodes scapularis]|eukprot:XP_002413642.1 POGO family transposase, putative [Ixodes scapularis]